jgi:hypothetical protein
MKQFKFNTITQAMFNDSKEYYSRKTIDAHDRKEATEAIERLGYSMEVIKGELFYTKRNK